MLTVISLTLLGAAAMAQDLDSTVFAESETMGTIESHSETVACASGSIANQAGACELATQCGGTAKWLVENPQPSETEAEVSMFPGRVVGTNALEMYVTHGAVNGRVVNQIIVNPDNAACNYPGPYWTKGVDSSGSTCFDVYRSNIPWSVAYNGGGTEASQKTEACAMTREQNVTSVYFEGNANVVMNEQFQFDGETQDRTLEQLVQFGLTQPRTITDITTEVEIIMDPRLLSAITEQSFDYVTGLATLKLKISTASPLLTVSTGLTTTGPEAIGISSPTEGALINVGTTCETSTEDKSCLQEHVFILDPQAACEFDGRYQFFMNVECREDVIGTEACPLDDLASQLEVAVNLDSENICDIVQGLLEVEASMTSHGEFTPAGAFGTFGPIKNAFFQDQTIHFQLIVDSLNAFPFESSVIEEVRAAATAVGQDLVIYNRVAAEADVSSVLFDYTQQSDQSPDVQHIHQFQFSPKADSAFGAVGRNQPVDSPIEADISLVFLNSLGAPEKRKRTIKFNAVGKRQAVDNSGEATAEFTVELMPRDDAPEEATLLTPIESLDDEQLSTAGTVVVSLTMMALVATISLI